MRKAATSGQMLIMAIMIAAVLAISMPVLFTIFGRLQRLYADSATEVKLNQTAQAAFARVNYTLTADPHAWNRALANEGLAEMGFDGQRLFVGANKIPYSVLCAKDPMMLPNQLRVTVRVQNKGRAFQKQKTYHAIFSRRTMGVDLPAMRHAPAALYLLGDLDLGRQGLTEPELDVQWGSVVCFGSIRLEKEANAETLGHHPRKFCQGDFQAPYAKNQSSDAQEFWSRRSLGNPVIIDDDRYRATASSQTVQSKGDAADHNASSGYISVPNQVVAIRTLSTQGQEHEIPVMYFDGSVRFESDGIDMGSGALVVTQNAVFENHKEGIELPLQVPSYAAREYPYLPEGGRFPCQDNAGATCNPEQAIGPGAKIDFHGFLYVKGDLDVNQDTTLAGVLRVDGTLRVKDGKRLTVLFDDRVSRSIFTTGTEIQQITLME